MVTRDPLVDSYGRVHRDLRISVTDRCSLRCTYCMPEDGVPWLPRATMLTTEEVVRIADVAVSMGIEEVRLTGGEPLLRRDLVDVVAGITALEGPAGSPEVSMTTNAIGLAKNAAALHEAGMTRVNVSLDTLRRDVFISLAKRDRLADTLAGVHAAAEAGMVPVKINTVLMRGVNDAPEDVVALLTFALEHGYELRFIEQMPLDAQHGWDRSRMVTADEILADLGRQVRLTPLPGRGSAPAEKFLVDDGPHTVGIIGSVTRPFCSDCDRVRLTADGQVRTCLFAREESDLRGPLREGASDLELAERWAAAMWGKKAGHGIDDPSFLQPDRPMSSIGG